MEERNFNSIKVQLELYIVGNHFCSSFYFNSIKVQLEPASTCSQVSASADFNSIKVQLERSYLWLLPQSTIFQFHKGTIRTLCPFLASLPLRHFNSIKVQLELCGSFSFPKRNELFQFHKGTIRTFSQLNLPARSIISIP